MHSIADQLAALQRIAAFSVKLGGHELGEWQTVGTCALASCIRCGRQVRVYCSLLEPDVDGPALEGPCAQGAVDRAA